MRGLANIWDPGLCSIRNHSFENILWVWVWAFATCNLSSQLQPLAIQYSGFAICLHVRLKMNITGINGSQIMLSNSRAWLNNSNPLRYKMCFTQEVERKAYFPYCNLQGSVDSSGWLSQISLSWISFMFPFLASFMNHLLVLKMFAHANHPVSYIAENKHSQKITHVGCAYRMS